ncbi:MAG: hypothetical protein BGO01_17075 [Armatimonadetes bacterium 55-13]|nr:ring-cleaving dioxygenase [Armatimonadota bacterium]OJU63869.1 MAG: hypothetical protein BGO01_17075 [Armatimonadetes bacterium 55-13]
MSTHTIHHVTAVSARIKDNRQFYTEVLGLRLVKKSVNQDDLSAYHLFYADAVGTPGTDMTFFDWPDIDTNVPGAGTVALTSFLVPGSSLDWWVSRLEEAGSAPFREVDDQDRDRILFSDPEGQRLELVDSSGLATPATPYGKVVPEENAIQGILGVDLESANPQATRRVLTELLGYTEHGDIFETGDETSFARVRLVPAISGRFGRIGSGGIHHVAFRVKDEDEILQMQDKLERAGLSTSGLVNRYYFQSLYFREPGGILFEMATEGPGFAADEPLETMGERLALPPFLEPRRQEIEAGLKPL